MIPIPAVDIRGGACVQLVGGSYDHEVVRLPDPVAVARRWGELGFQRLHVVDLDAATRRGTNTPLVHSILGRGVWPEVQVGGGIRHSDQIVDLLHHGAARVVVGTRAIEEPAWLAGVAESFPDRLIVAADVRGRRVVTHGWATELDLDIADALSAFRGLPLAGVLVTAVHQEGQLHGPDVELMRLVVEGAGVEVYAAGGIATLADLHALAGCGVNAAVIGTALYTGALDAREVVTEFCQ
jgi:phosphoribosylformimino-5-aminoimidazole carboxamide ribotide isomerase